jgi:hypothetical protein
MNRFVFVSLTLAVAVAALMGCGDDVRVPSAPPDPSPPSAVADLAVAIEQDSVIVLTWTAPSDVGYFGKASVYDLRYSTSPITENTWEEALQAQGEPAPEDPGATERFAVPGLRPRTSYYFALRALDRRGNLSDLSNTVLLDVDPPTAIDDLAATRATSRTIALTWTAPSENGPPGRASSYEIRYSQDVISEDDWDSAAPATGAPVPAQEGTQESFVVTGLEPQTFYYLAVRSEDRSGNLSSISNVIEAATNTDPQGWWDGFAVQGPNGDVSALLPFGSDLVVGGTFTVAGTVPASRIALWDGDNWLPMSSGFDKGPGTTGVRSLAVYDQETIAGGIFGLSGTRQINNVARWDGSAWLPLGLGTNGMVIAMAPYAGDLYVGGIFSTAGGLDNTAIARWDGSMWHQMGWSLEDADGVTSLIVFNGELIAGGSFSRAAGTDAENIAAWTGSAWRPLGEGFGGGDPITAVRCLAVHNGDLIAGGSFQFSGATTVNNIARWDGISWSPLGEGVGDDPYEDSVSALAVYNGDLIAAGRFTVEGQPGLNNIARWNGSAWVSMDGGVTGSDDFTGVNALAVSNGSLFAGGHFQFAGEIQSFNIARWDD